MKAIILNEPGGTDALQYTDLPKPVPQSHEVLVQIKAISINPVDVKTRMGKGIYGRIKADSPLVIGWDIAGVVVEVGDEVETFQKGDAVFGMVNFPGYGGAYAEYVAAPADQLALKPPSISYQEAAASTLAALTAYQAIFEKANVKAGQRVLIHAAAGGVGHFAVQLAKRIGAYVIGTSSASNRDFVLSLGADQHIDYPTTCFEKEVLNVDLVLDTVGGDTIARSLKVIKPGGTLISIPTGIPAELTAQAHKAGVNAFFFLVQSSGYDMRQLAEPLSYHQLKAHVSQSFSFDEMPQAHAQVASGRTVGKVVVEL
ncbi:NADPH:quinone reductase [Catalinimonas alkaloidigena]|uniref:NADPH:quinone reductase n=1 Tax=Catalinimonas alkaloidigena TaxID=1075417 RepID=A0A1G9P6D5_9BACT|nr:NADP-dependent oxidoreductase [Catalinimonas alkaloidigena]SDL94299.1 NADPH:quinone reductase [Catalinimonas alkaloidigena]